MGNFAHLHLHTEYSLLDGACKITDLVRRVSELSQTAVAITDHGVMYGVVDFYKACKAEGIKPIIGCEVYVASRSRFDRVYEMDAESAHLVLLCKNQTGYKNLLKLVSLAYTEGFYIKPRVDMELLKEYSEGLVCMSACLAGQIPRLILNGDYEGAKALALEYRDMFGEDSYYLEVQDHGIPEQKRVNLAIARLSRETGIGMVATNDAHYLTREKAYMQDVLLCIQTNRTVDETDRMKFEGSEFYIKSAEEMESLFAGFEGAVENTQKIADMCSVEFEFGKYQLPVFPLPEGVDHFETLKEKCLAGFERLYPDGCPEYKERLFSELSVVREMGFVDYFLIVGDFIEFAKGRGIAVGPGRGSAAGSLVSYCLNITTIDPVKYSLYFERFLNPERISMPDIDIDFCVERRSEVIDYVISKYGAERVVQIATFGTMAARAAVRDVGRALNIPYGEVDVVAKAVPFELGMTLAKALKASPTLKELYDSDPKTRKLIDTAMELEGMPRHVSVHAAGVVITPRDANEYVPLSKSDEAVITQFTMKNIEALGLLKMDFLGLRNLTIIENCVKLVKKCEPDFEICKIPEEDSDTFDMLSQGKTFGVFQLESDGMTNVVKRLGPRSIEDITAVIALYRPGPMESIPQYIESRHNPGKIKYKHPLLRDILEVTYGCTVYQEQVMEIFRKLGGYSLGRADLVRRAMSKKQMNLLEKERKNFIFGNLEENIPGAISNGVPQYVANELFDELLAFANYAFNKAHAAAYAVVSYQTAYLKCHYPREYMAALLTSIMGETGKVAWYISSCRENGLCVLPPDVNLSGEGFVVDGENLRYGLSAVKNVGRQIISQMVEERETNGMFTGFGDFITRMGRYEINRRAVEGLIKCGALDSFGTTRASMLAALDNALEGASSTRRKNVSGQMDLFSSEESPSRGDSLPYIAEFSLRELLSMEKAATGMFLSGHPLDEYKDGLIGLNITCISTITDVEEDSPPPEGDLLIIGVITEIRMKTTKNNAQMAYITLEDATGSIEVILFPKVLLDYGAYIHKDNSVYVSGHADIREGVATKIICDSIGNITNIRETLSKPKKSYGRAPTKDIEKPEMTNNTQKIYLRFTAQNNKNRFRAASLLRMFRGRMPVVFYDEESKIRENLPVEEGLSPLPEVLDYLVELLGIDNVVIK